MFNPTTMYAYIGFPSDFQWPSFVTAISSLASIRGVKISTPDLEVTGREDHASSTVLPHLYKPP